MTSYTAQANNRKRDRHSKQSARYSPDIQFCGLDGEGIKTAKGDRYVLLQADGARPLVNLDGLRSVEIFDWLFELDDDQTLIGYGFNYDFENFFVDLTELEYINLVNGYAVYHDGYTLSYVPRKILRVLEGDHVGHDGRLFYAAGRRRTIYNVISFFQTTFVGALRSFGQGDLVTDVIDDGKAARGSFKARDLASLIEYNRQECVALTRLMTTFWEQCRAGFRAANVPIALRKKDCYGPGAFASAFLKSIAWTDRYPVPWYKSDRFIKDLDARLVKSVRALEHDDESGSLLLRHFPFAASFYGGRIELGALGQFDTLHAHDIASAYPAAMSRLPAWEVGDTAFTTDRRWTARAVERRLIGMYLVRWQFPAGWSWYPFPYRAWSKNVMFPRSGLGWIMAPELFAAIDTGLQKYLTIEAAYYLRGSRDLGAGTEPLAEARRTAPAASIMELYELRRQFKQSTDEQQRGAQLPLKLTLNSCYGKLLQQVGATLDNPKFFCDLSASWITSWTRAMIWRAIAPHAAGNDIIAVQTDGVYARVPIDVRQGGALGDWERETCHDVLMLLPGIYQYTDERGNVHKKNRGQTRHFDHAQARAVLYGKRPDYIYSYPCFIGSRHAIAQPDTYGHLRLQWCEIQKEYTPDLRSKRRSPAKIVLKRAHQFFPPKDNPAPEFCARPFSLKFGKTPYLISSESALMEDAAGEDGLFVAGISE